MDCKWVIKEDSLIQEAKKYKSADDMIKSMENKWDILYHGTDEVFEEYDVNKAINKWEHWQNLWWLWFYTTPNKWTAILYGKNLMKLKVDIKNPLDLSNFKSVQELADYLDMSEDALIMRNWIPTTKWAYANQLWSNAEYLWHDAIIWNNWKEIVLLKKADVKTESQLRKIREKANKQIIPIKK